MEIKVDLDYLEKQIEACDIRACNTNSEDEEVLWSGLAGLLSVIRYDVVNNGIAKIVTKQN